ncbi:glycosyltransferase family 4 protein [Gudongella sp. SC589]|uniref:glycosyltransferase family 4 protein n=1 Tax=Gudongella sp. SC589 TaxID=3385990 RepID=UPI0039047633
MKIAIIPTGKLPIPAVMGGAVETGIQQLIEQNEIHELLDITVFSINNNEAREESKKYNNTRFVFLNNPKIASNIIRIINKIFRTLGVKFVLNHNYFFNRGIVKFLKNHKFDHILLKNAISSTLQISKVAGDNLILQLHNDFLNSEVYKAETIYNKCNKIFVNSNYIKDRVLTIKNSDASKIFVNKNCTDPTVFNRELYLDYVQEFKNKYNIKNNEVVILFTGRIIPEKGIAELIQAVKKSSNKYKIKLLIVGSKWFSNNKKSSFEKYLESICTSIEDQIIFTGYVPYQELPKIHAISDIAVVPSIWEEPAGRVVIEAEASGIPVIVTDAGGISDYINPKSSIVVNRDDKFVDNLSEAINKLIEDKALRTQMGMDGRKFACDFSPEHYYNELIELLKY